MNSSIVNTVHQSHIEIIWLEIIMELQKLCMISCAMRTQRHYFIFRTFLQDTYIFRYKYLHVYIMLKPHTCQIIQRCWLPWTLHKLFEYCNKPPCIEGAPDTIIFIKSRDIRTSNHNFIIVINTLGLRTLKDHFFTKRIEWNPIWIHSLRNKQRDSYRITLQEELKNK